MTQIEINNELARLKERVSQLEADRDNWRKQALEENARCDKVIESVRSFLAAEEIERFARDRAHKAWQRKGKAFEELSSIIRCKEKPDAH